MNQKPLKVRAHPGQGQQLRRVAAGAHGQRWSPDSTVDPLEVLGTVVMLAILISACTLPTPVQENPLLGRWEEAARKQSLEFFLDGTVKYSRPGAAERPEDTGTYRIVQGVTEKQMVVISWKTIKAEVGLDFTVSGNTLTLINPVDRTSRRYTRK